MMNGSNIAGANSGKGRVENDYYATNPADTMAFLELIEHEYDLNNANILEPAAGEGHIMNVLKNRYVNSNITGRDLIDRGNSEIESGINFVEERRLETFDYVITNPPFKLAREFIDKALTVSGNVFMFAKLQLLEGKSRKNWFKKSHLKYVYVYSYRANPWRNGQSTDDTGKKWSSTMAFAWYVFDESYNGEPTVRWI